MRRLLETGAICWFAMGAMLIGGGAAAISTPAIIFSSPESRRRIPEAAVRGSDAAVFWFLVVGLLIWIGVVEFRGPSPKKRR